MRLQLVGQVLDLLGSDVVGEQVRERDQPSVDLGPESALLLALRRMKVATLAAIGASASFMHAPNSVRDDCKLGSANRRRYQ